MILGLVLIDGDLLPFNELPDHCQEYKYEIYQESGRNYNWLQISNNEILVVVFASEELI